jgi:hypothetical protein
MENLRIVLYTGNLDVILGPAAAEIFYRRHPVERSGRRFERAA